MESMKNSKKIIILGVILLIIAGIIVVSLKGFNVALTFGKHESVELKVGKEINMNDVNEICSEIFGKKYVAKELEVFGDSFQINVESITDEEKASLIEKVNEKFEVEKKVEDLNINSISNRRIRDVLTQYILPMTITFAIVIVYMLIRFKKINAINIVIKCVLKIILVQAIYYSLVAIIRIPVSDLIINISMLISILQLVYFVNKEEKELSKINE